MFKKLKKRLEVEEGQPTFLGKPGTAVRSSINDSSSNVPVESVVNSNLEQQQQASKETDNGESLSDTNTASTQELKEVSQFKTATQNNGMPVYLLHVWLVIRHSTLTASA